jgi:hypothetical protein
MILHRTVIFNQNTLPTPGWAGRHQDMNILVRFQDGFYLCTIHSTQSSKLTDATLRTQLVDSFWSDNQQEVVEWLYKYNVRGLG